MSVASSAYASYSTGNWTMFRSNPSHSGAINGNGPTNSAKLLWNFTTMQRVVSSPAVANGYVFVGSYEGAVYCLNSSNGKIMWNYPNGNEVT